MNFASLDAVETSSGRTSYVVTFYTDGVSKKIEVYRSLEKAQSRSIEWEVSNERKT